MTERKFQVTGDAMPGDKPAPTEKLQQERDAAGQVPSTPAEPEPKMNENERGPGSDGGGTIPLDRGR